MARRRPLNRATDPTSPGAHLLDHVLLGSLFCSVAAHLLWALSGWRPPALLPWIADGMLCLTFCLAAALCWRAAGRSQNLGAGREARAWQLFSLGLLSWAAGEGYSLSIERFGVSVPFPTWSDLGFLLLPLLFALGILRLPRARLRRVQALGFGLDVLIVLTTLAALFWQLFMAGNIATYTADLASLVIAQAYPSSDLLLFALLLVVLLWRPAGAVGLALLPFSLGLALFFSADVYYAITMGNGSYANGRPGDVLWTAATLAFGSAAFVAQRPLGRLSRRVLAWLDRSQALLGALPYLSVAISYTLLSTVTDHRGPKALGVLIAALAVTAFVLARQFLALRENANLSRKLSWDADHDALTGLLTRAALLRRADEVVARAQQQGGQAALLFLDLDRFKQVNDTLGHAAGDELLRAVGERLRLVVRDSDTLARLGGDEFVILIDRLDDPASAGGIAERAVAALARPFRVAGHDASVSVSIGVARLPNDAASAAQALRKADLAMYAAKQAGRNGYALFDAVLAEHQRDRLTLEADLRGAAERGELGVHYQPQFSAAGAQLRGFEALLRWSHPTRGAVSPAEFIPIAEEAGFVHELGSWVLAEVARQAAAWGGALGGLTLSVNVSVLEFAHPDFVSRVRAAVGQGRLTAQQLTVELTETAVMSDLDVARAKLRELRALGVRVSLDDFGTGHSSLSSLRALEADELKLDRSFTRDLASGPRAEAVFRAVVLLAHGLGLSVIAEGIESPEQFSLVAACGTDDVQGFHLGRPLSPEAAEHLMRTHQAAARCA